MVRALFPTPPAEIQSKALQMFQYSKKSTLKYHHVHKIDNYLRFMSKITFILDIIA